MWFLTATQAFEGVFLYKSSSLFKRYAELTFLPPGRSESLPRWDLPTRRIRVRRHTTAGNRRSKLKGISHYSIDGS